MAKQPTPTKQPSILDKIRSHPLIAEITIIVIALLAIGLYLVINHINSRVYIENAEISTPIITLDAPTTGILDKVKVEIGDTVGKGAIVATIGETPLRTKTAGIIVDTLDAPGQLVTPQTPIVKMIDPANYRLIGQVDENKGLADIKPGQQVVFTVDAYPGKKYEGQVDVVTPTSHESDVVFSISDKLQTKRFDVRVTFDPARYPELKNGISAKMWIYK